MLYPISDHHVASCVWLRNSFLSFSASDVTSPGCRLSSRASGI